MTERGFFEAEAGRPRADSTRPVASARADASRDTAIPSGPVSSEAAGSVQSEDTARVRLAPPRKVKSPGVRRRGLRLLWWGLQVGAALIVGVLLFDRLLMPAVVRQGDEVQVPDVRGWATDKAREAVKSAGLESVVSQGRFDGQASFGSIVESSPGPGVTVKQGRQVYLTPSLGKENRVVPDLHGMSVRLATMKLEEVGLRVGVTDQAASDALSPGQILATHPPAGAPVPAAGDVALLVSRKKAPIPLWMPNLAGREGSESAAWLESCGFQVRLSETSLPGDAGSVLEQDPLPGAPVWPGGLIRLTVVRARDQFDGEREGDRSGRWRR